MILYAKDDLAHLLPGGPVTYTSEEGMDAVSLRHYFLSLDFSAFAEAACMVVGISGAVGALYCLVPQV